MGLAAGKDRIATIAGELGGAKARHPRRSRWIACGG